MSLEALPEELQSTIVDMLAPSDVKRFMQTCRAGRALGRRAKVWTTMREQHGLPSPKARATKYKTDHDVVARILCRLCWERRSLAIKHNICSTCSSDSPLLWARTCIIRRARADLKRDKRHLATLQIKVSLSESSITECKAAMEGEVARIQKLA